MLRHDPTPLSLRVRSLHTLLYAPHGRSPPTFSFCRTLTLVVTTIMYDCLTRMIRSTVPNATLTQRHIDSFIPRTALTTHQLHTRARGQVATGINSIGVSAVCGANNERWWEVCVSCTWRIHSLEADVDVDRLHIRRTGMAMADGETETSTAQSYKRQPSARGW